MDIVGLLGIGLEGGSCPTEARIDSAEIIGAAESAFRYWRWLCPAARKELDRWLSHARAIDDDEMRDIAIAKITGERRNVEAAAFVAALAGSRSSQVLPAIVAFQVAYEFLDGLNEMPVHSNLDTGLRLHGALMDAVGGMRNDHGAGAYVQALVDHCRAGCGSPTPALLGAVGRIGEAQARCHSRQARAELERWADARPSTLRWWETAAAGISSIDVLAMLATPASQHHRILNAYTELLAVSALLDAMADHYTDPPANLNWIRFYRSHEELAERLDVLSASAQGWLSDLPDAILHRLLLAGVVAHNTLVVAPDLRWAIPRVPFSRFVIQLMRMSRHSGR